MYDEDLQKCNRCEGVSITGHSADDCDTILGLRCELYAIEMTRTIQKSFAETPVSEATVTDDEIASSFTAFVKQQFGEAFEFANGDPKCSPFYKSFAAGFLARRGTPNPCDCWCQCGTLCNEPPNPQDGMKHAPWAITLITRPGGCHYDDCV